MPEEFGKWSSVYRQFRRCTLASSLIVSSPLNASKVNLALNSVQYCFRFDIPDLLRFEDQQTTNCSSRQRPISGEEFSFNRLECSSRLATRYGKTAASYLGFIKMIAARLWVRSCSTWLKIIRQIFFPSNRRQKKPPHNLVQTLLLCIRYRPDRKVYRNPETPASSPRFVPICRLS